jgi:hypothetical protein
MFRKEIGPIGSQLKANSIEPKVPKKADNSFAHRFLSQSTKIFLKKRKTFFQLFVFLRSKFKRRLKRRRRWLRRKMSVSQRLENLPKKHLENDSGLPDFSWYSIPKREKIYRNDHKNIPKGHKLYTKRQ